MLRIGLELFVLLVLAHATRSATFSFTPYSKSFISDKLKEEFFDTNINSNMTLQEFRQSLKRFQHKLLKMRNADCLYQNQGRVDMSVISLNEYSSKSDSRWHELIDLWSNFNITNNQSYSARILRNLNEMVFSLLLNI
jgi:hypothetical protein